MHCVRKLNMDSLCDFLTSVLRGAIHQLYVYSSRMVPHELEFSAD